LDKPLISNYSSIGPKNGRKFRKADISEAHKKNYPMIKAISTSNAVKKSSRVPFL
jgi:hypothetical protein